MLALDVEDVRDQLLEHFLIVAHIGRLAPPPRLDSLQNLVVTRPKNNAGVIPESPHLINHLVLDIVEESVRCGVDGVAEHEVLKYHDPFARGLLIELVDFVLSSSPDPEHVEVGLNCVLDQLLEGVLGIEVAIDEAGVHHIGRHVICSFAVHWIAIDRDLKVSATLIQLHRPDPIDHFPLIHSIPVHQQFE
jgi:hypothetical protein